jgi:hypothetical protein
LAAVHCKAGDIGDSGVHNHRLSALETFNMTIRNHALWAAAMLFSTGANGSSQAENGAESARAVMLMLRISGSDTAT